MLKNIIVSISCSFNIAFSGQFKSKVRLIYNIKILYLINLPQRSTYNSCVVFLLANSRFICRMEIASFNIIFFLIYV